MIHRYEAIFLDECFCHNVCRCAIVGCYMTEDYFLENEGVFLLIDLLEVSEEC